MDCCWLFRFVGLEEFHKLARRHDADALIAPQGVQSTVTRHQVVGSATHGSGQDMVAMTRSQAAFRRMS